MYHEPVDIKIASSLKSHPLYIRNNTQEEEGEEEEKKATGSQPRRRIDEGFQRRPIFKANQKVTLHRKSSIPSVLQC